MPTCCEAVPTWQTTRRPCYRSSFTAEPSRREELSHEGIERMAANGPISTRLLEAASAAARVARELGDALGVGPRAAAELHQIRAETALSMAVLAREAPAVLAAIQRALAACGLEERGRGGLRCPVGSATGGGSRWQLTRRLT